MGWVLILEQVFCRQGMVCSSLGMRHPKNVALWPTAFVRKSLIITEMHYSNIESEALCTLHGLEKFHHYC